MAKSWQHELNWSRSISQSIELNMFRSYKLMIKLPFSIQSKFRCLERFFGRKVSQFIPLLCSQQLIQRMSLLEQEPWHEILLIICQFLLSWAFHQLSKNLFICPILFLNPLFLRVRLSISLFYLIRQIAFIPLLFPKADSIGAAFFLYWFKNLLANRPYPAKSPGLYLDVPKPIR